MATYAKTNLLSHSLTGSLPLDQLQIPHDGDEEIYRVRQFNTTSKGFVNRGYLKKTIFFFFSQIFDFSDSFKRSFKRSGSISRRSSFRKGDRTPSQEHVNDSILLNNIKVTKMLIF